MVTKPPAPVRRLARPLSGGLAAPAPLPHQPPVFTPEWRSAPVLTPDDLSAALPALLSLWPRNQAPRPVCAFAGVRRPRDAACRRISGRRGPVPPAPLDVASAASSPRPHPRSVGAGRALSVRVPLCRCGSAASQGPGLAAALCRGRSALCCPLPPSVAAPDRTSGGRAAQGGPVRRLRRLRLARPPRASAVVRRRAPSRCPGTPRRMVPAAHPRHAKRVTAAKCGQSRSKTPSPSNPRQVKAPVTVASNPARQRLPLATPRQAQAPVTGRTISPAPNIGWRFAPSRPFFPGLKGG